MATPTGFVRLLPILLVQFIGSLGFSIVLPFLIVLVLEFGGNEVVYGIVGATYAGFQLVGAPVLGKLSDRVGRRKILIVSQAGTLVAWLIFAWAFFVNEGVSFFHSDGGWLGTFTLSLPLAMIAGARALDGLTGGNVSVATAYMADVSTDATRKANFGLMGAAGNLGFMVGPALGGLLTAAVVFGKSNLLPVLVSAGISLVALLVIVALLRDPPPKSSAFTAEPELRFGQILRLPGVFSLLVVYFLIFLGFNFFYVAFPVYATDGLGWSTARLGAFFSVLSVALVAVEGPLMRYLGGRATDRQLYTVGGLVLAGAFATFAFATGDWLYLAAVLFGLGNGLMWPSFTSLLAAAAGDRYQGAVQGYGSSFGSAAAIVGLVAGGVLYGLMGPWVFGLSAGFILLSTAALSLVRLR